MPNGRDVLSTQATPLEALLDPSDVQSTLKLSSRRAARELIVAEMDHVLVGRTPMTTSAWLAEWLELRRRGPRRRVSGHLADPVSVAGGAAAERPRLRSRVPAPRRRAKTS
jgi:hypothetical protein